MHQIDVSSPFKTYLSFEFMYQIDLSTYKSYMYVIPLFCIDVCTFVTDLKVHVLVDKFMAMCAPWEQIRVCSPNNHC